MNLSNISTKELEQELESRRIARNNRPKEIEKPDFSSAIEMARQYLTFLEKGGLGDHEDYELYVCERVLEAVYGDGIFSYMMNLEEMNEVERSK